MLVTPAFQPSNPLTIFHVSWKVWPTVILEPACTPTAEERGSVRRAVRRKRASPHGRQPHSAVSLRGILRLSVESSNLTPFWPWCIPSRWMFKVALKLWNTCILSRSLSFLASRPLFKSFYILFFLNLKNKVCARLAWKMYSINMWGKNYYSLSL